MSKSASHQVTSVMVLGTIVAKKQAPFPFAACRAHWLKALHPINLRTATHRQPFKSSWRFWIDLTSTSRFWMYGRKPKLGSGLAKLPRQKLRAVSYRHIGKQRGI